MQGVIAFVAFMMSHAQDGILRASAPMAVILSGSLIILKTLCRVYGMPALALIYEKLKQVK